MSPFGELMFMFMWELGFPPICANWPKLFMEDIFEFMGLEFIGLAPI